MQRILLLAVGFVAAPMVAVANPVTASAPNSFATAQNVNPFFSFDFHPNIGTGFGAGFVNTSTTLAHVEITRTAQANGGFNFFRFTTSSPGIIIADIDSSAVPTNFDTHIHLYNALGAPLTSSDDNDGDPGDGPGLVGGTFNSRIETGILPAGDYYVGVAQFLSTPSPGGGITTPFGAGATYSLNISANANLPEPASLALFGLGIAALGGIGWRRSRKA